MGLAKGEYEERADDTLELVDCRIANAVRCVPPQNKPEPGEIKTCRQFLNSELETLPNVKVILALGKIAHDSVCERWACARHCIRSSTARLRYRQIQADLAAIIARATTPIPAC